MFSSFLGWLLKSKGMKVGAGAVSGSGLLVLLYSANAEINIRFEKQESRQKEYVNLSLKPIQTEISNIKTQQTEIKSMVRDIHSYLLKSKE